MIVLTSLLTKPSLLMEKEIKLTEYRVSESECSHL